MELLEPVPIPTYIDVVENNVSVNDSAQGQAGQLHHRSTRGRQLTCYRSSRIQFGTFNGASAQITKLARTLCAEFHRQWAALVTREYAPSREEMGGVFTCYFPAEKHLVRFRHE